ncbi:hypothetical protein F5Y11DRAFT_367643 [Daldinia sp. FL1419]|nr:hypothetical protein F5Y11DRAFT_367643 [Daldinia sp. FL1419]
MSAQHLCRLIYFQAPLEEVRRVIEDAADKNEYVSAKIEAGSTALHWAARYDRLDIVRLLIEYVTDKPAYINTRNYFGKTVIDIAIKRSRSPFAKNLIRFLIWGDELYDSIDGGADLDPATPAVDGYITSRFLEKRINPIEESSGKTTWDLACIPEPKELGVIAILILQEDTDRIVRTFVGSCDDWIVIHGNYMGPVNVLLGCSARRLLEIPEESDQITSELIECLKGILIQVHREFHENQEAPRHLRFREPLCIFQPLERPIAGSEDFISLVMPYIFVDELRTMNHRRAISEMLSTHPIYCTSDEGRWLERHMPLTLDEYCRPALSRSDLKARNRDQVLVRYDNGRREPSRSNTAEKDPPKLLSDLWVLVRGRISKVLHLTGLLTWESSKPQSSEVALEQRGLPPRVIFIWQAWIWKIGDLVIATWPDATVHMPWRNISGYSDKRIGIAFVLRYLVELFDKPANNASGSLLQVYETELSAIYSKVNRYAKNVLVEDIDVDKERKFFHEISDLREELSMIKSVLAEQEEVWKDFMSTAWPQQDLGQQQQGRALDGEDIGRGLSKVPAGFKDEAEWNAVCRPRLLFNRYKRRIEKLEEDAERVERNISTQLDLKQKHAALKEAHSTAIVSAMVFGFTIITVIFAPLSFVVALFALPIDKFNEGKNENRPDGVYSSDYIGRWSATTVLVSIAVTLLAIWAGLRFTGLHIWGKKGLRAYIREKASATQGEEKDMEPEDMDKDDTDDEDMEGNTEVNRRKDAGGGNMTETGREKKAGCWSRLERIVRKRHTHRGDDRTTEVELA